MDKKKPNQRSGRVRNGIKWAFLICGVLICTIAFGVSAIILAMKTDWVHVRIQNKINELIPGEIYYETPEFSLFGGWLHIHLFQIKDAQQNLVCGFDNFTLKIAYGRLFKKELVIQEVLLDGPYADLILLEDGELNIVQSVTPIAAKSNKIPPPPETKKEPSGTLPINIIVENLTIKSGKTAFRIPHQNLETLLSGFRLKLNFNLLAQTGKIFIQAQNSHFKNPDVNLLLDTFSLRADVADNQVNPIELLIKTNLNKTKISGKISGLLKDQHLDLACVTDVFLANITPNTHIKQKFNGLLNLDLKVVGTVDNPLVLLKMDYGGGVLADIPVDKIDIDTQLKDLNLTLENLLVAGFSGDTNLSGQISLRDVFPNGLTQKPINIDKLQYGLTSHTNHIAIHQLPGFNSEIQGQLNAAIDINGTGVQPKEIKCRSDIELAINEITSKHLAKPVDLRLSAQAHLEKENFTLKKLTVHSEMIEAQADAGFNVDTQTLKSDFHLSIPDLNQLLANLGILDTFGKIDIKGHARGSAKNPEAEIVLDANTLAFQTTKLGDIHGQISLAKGVLNIKEIMLQNQSSQLQIKGQANLLDQKTLAPYKNPQFNLKVIGSPILIENFMDSLKGQIRIHADLSGTPAAPVGDIELAVRNLDLGVQKIPEINILSVLNNDQVHIDPIEIKLSDKKSIIGKAFYGFDQTYKLDLEALDIPFDLIDMLKQNQEVTGGFTINAKGEGQIANPQLNAQIRIHDLQVKKEPLRDLNLKVQMADQRIVFNGSQDFKLDGLLDLKTKQLNASISFNKMTLAPIFNMLKIKAMTGLVNGEIKASGNIENIDQMEASAIFDQFKIDFEDKRVLESTKLHAQFKNKNLDIPHINFKLGETGALNLSGKTLNSQSLDFNMKGDIPLDIVKYFAPDAPATKGNIKISAFASGPFKTPDIGAEINLENISLLVPELEQRLHQVNGRILASQKRIVIDQLDGKLDSGQFQIKSLIDLDNFKPQKVSTQIIAQNLPIKIPDTLDLTFNAELNVSGTPDDSKTVGEIVILDGRFEKDIELNYGKMITQKSRKESAPAKPIDVPFLKNMELDVAIKHRQPFVVENNLADMGIAPDLIIAGTVNQPAVKGRAVVENGTLTYQKKTFVITKGVIDFVNPYKIEPNLDIVSEVKIRKWIVTLNISGSPDNLILKLSSVPKETDGDILSILLFNRTTGELIAGEGGSQQSNAQILAALLASNFGEDIQEQTGLDIIALETQDAAEHSNSDRVKLTVGKKVSKRLTLKYAVESKNGEMIQQAISEYQVLENILVNGHQDSNGIFGGEMIYRIEFR